MIGGTKCRVTRIYYTSAYHAFVNQSIHSNTKIALRLSGAEARTDARSDHAVLDFFVAFCVKAKSKTRITVNNHTYNYLKTISTRMHYV
jgi:hypothetical protein